MILRIFLCLTTALLHHVTSEPCGITGGRNEVILDVTESIGQEFNQTIEPRELPIEGDPTSEIELELTKKGVGKFSLQGKTLNLLQPLDREADGQSTLLFEISCGVRGSTRTRSIPMVLRIQDLNDNAPQFVGAPYELKLREDAKVKSPIFKGIRATDLDSGRNGQVEYQILDVSPASGSQLFSIRFPHQGVLFLEAPLDYETSSVYYITISATDFSADVEERLNSSTVMTITVEDVDDQDPIFDTASTPASDCESQTSTGCIPEYRALVIEGEVRGVLDVFPGRIHAKDQDSLGAAIIYSFELGTPSNFNHYFDIDPRSGVITQKQAINRAQVKEFEIIIQALEKTAGKGKAIAKLKIIVQDVDASPPVVVIPSYSGKVPEASKPGTPVLRDDGSELPFVFSVTDSDMEEGEVSPKYIFELTTSAFKVTNEGALVVASPNLDRDSPNLPEHTFQVIAREDKEGGAASAPVPISVRLLDINDNAPMIPVLPTIRISAGSQKRKILQLRATDRDEGINAVVHYELLSGDKENFSIDSNTGDVYALGEMKAGDEFFLNIKVSDSGDLSTESFFKVVVSRGPNTSGPIFTQSRYSATVPEDIAYGGKFITVKANDPDGEASYFSISGGDGSKTFEVDTLTGLITVVAPLDRERKDEYELIIKAEDSERKSNTATVIISVTDVNDESPVFVGEPYSFRVDEGQPNASVGVVKAEDKDLGKFGEVAYLIEGKTTLFRINSLSGEIFTNSSLDYEKEQAHSVSVVAHDMATDQLSSTTTVTILVNDISDEAPVFEKESYTIHVRENAAIGALLLTVSANDPDTMSSITYRIIEGDSNIFKVTPDSGRITLAAALDYELITNYTLVIGTEENAGKDQGARTMVTILVDDINDEIPVLGPLHTTTFPKTAPLLTLLANVTATDADGSKPNNEIRFSFAEENEATPYFNLDPEKGEIRLKRPLLDLDITEVMFKVTASDMGEPSHSASGEFRVLLLDEVIAEGFLDEDLSTLYEQDAAKYALASSPRFPKEFFSLQVVENIPIGSTIIKVPLVNATSSIACSIIQGNKDEMFRTMVTRQENCKIMTTKVLDYELASHYNLSLVLHPVGMTISDSLENSGSILSRAFVKIEIININDNSPSFLLKEFDVLENSVRDTILTFALQDYPLDTKIIQLTALDFDAGQQEMVEYRLLPESNRGNYFSVDANTGRIATKRRLVNVPLELQPFNLSLIAEDKPGVNGTQLSSTINVIIPVIEESHRSIVIMDASRSNVEEKVHFIKKVLSESTGKIAQIEQVRKTPNSDVDSTQVWFHLLDPKTLQPILHENILKVNQPEILSDVTSSLDGITAMQLTSPSEYNKQLEDEARKKAELILDKEKKKSNIAINLAESLGAIEYVLLGVGGLIILFVLCAIIIICSLWSSFTKKWNKADKTLMLLPPIIDRPGSVIDGVSKEYEVQVLHMSVPMDDESVPDVPLETESTRQYCLDNVSYISKPCTPHEGSSSAGSSGHGTPRVFVPESNDRYSRWSPENPSGDNFEHFPSEYLGDDLGGATFSASSTNSNVMFGRRGFPEPSPVETTTEL